MAVIAVKPAPRLRRASCRERDDGQGPRSEDSAMHQGKSVTKRHKAQEILAKLRHVDELAASGRRISDCMREIGVTEVTYYRWRNRYGGFPNDLAEHLTELEAEIARLRRAVSDLTLDKLILVEATTGTLSPELRAACVLHARAAFGISERRACLALGQHRSTQRKIGARVAGGAAGGLSEAFRGCTVVIDEPARSSVAATGQCDARRP